MQLNYRDYLKCKRNHLHFLNLGEGMIVCTGAGVTYHGKFALGVCPVTGLWLWLLGGRGRAAPGCSPLLEQRQGLLGLPLLSPVQGIPDFGCPWLSATAHSPAKSLSQDSVCQWDSSCKIWRYGVKILFPFEISKASASAVYPLEWQDTGLTQACDRDSSEMFWLIAWQAS